MFSPTFNQLEFKGKKMNEKSDKKSENMNRNNNDDSSWDTNTRTEYRKGLRLVRKYHEKREKESYKNLALQLKKQINFCLNRKGKNRYLSSTNIQLF